MERVQDAIAHQFVSRTKRDFVDLTQCKPFLLPLGVGPGPPMAVARGWEAVFLLRELQS